jgi:drug/metabolite transporter (DMT)-like permease
MSLAACYRKIRVRGSEPPPAESSEHAVGRSGTVEPPARARHRAVRGWAWIALVGGLCGLVPTALALSGAFDVQVAAAAAGALAATGGFGVGYLAWPGWRESESRRLLLSIAFFTIGAGTVLSSRGSASITEHAFRTT